MNRLPPLFTERIRQTFSAEEAEAFLTALDRPPAVSIRKHPLKPWEGFGTETPVPWHAEGYYLPERPEFIFDPSFHAGAYYVQESSSMFLQKALDKVDLPSGALVLDLCAAPGGKSTLLLSALPADALLVANEVIRTRIPALKENIQRWGYAHAMVTNADPADFEALPETFDLIAVDAPCSGEGMFRKDPEARTHWSPEALQTCELRQARILKSAAKALKTGGYLIYSTCTFNPGENEAQVQTLLDNGFEWIPVLDGADEFPEIARLPLGYAFYPHRVKGEGFFMALLRKTGETPYAPTDVRPRKPFFDKTVKPDNGFTRWVNNPETYVWKERTGTVHALPARHEKNILLLAASVQTMYAGVATGAPKGSDFMPDHALALSLAVHPDIQGIDLSEEEALRFLKKESLRTHDVPKGIYAVRYRGLNLGWVKAVPGRMNNLLPMEFRIRKHIEW